VKIAPPMEASLSAGLLGTHVARRAQADPGVGELLAAGRATWASSSSSARRASSLRIPRVGPTQRSSSTRMRSRSDAARVG
jgi:hypothetical protein